MSKATNGSVAFAWQPSRVGVFLSLLFLPLLLWLGFWQLDRADQKRLILATYQANQAAASVALGELDGADAQYRRVRVRGRYLPTPQLVIDNRVRHGRPGYEIAQLFAPSDGTPPLLVNRGWVAADLDRRTLPVLPAPTGEQTVEGSLYRRLPGGLQLDDRVAAPLADRQRVGWLDVPRLAGWLARPLYPYQLRLERGAPGALEVGWPVVAIYPQKHTGYAVQWFIMAAVLVLLTVLANSNLAAWLRAQRTKTTERDHDNS